MPRPMLLLVAAAEGTEPVEDAEAVLLAEVAATTSDGLKEPQWFWFRQALWPCASFWYLTIHCDMYS